MTDQPPKSHTTGTGPATREEGAADADTPGLVVGGRGGSGDELLIDGQEEVFSRTEVETGRIEHKAEAGSGEEAPAPFGTPHP